MSLILPATLFAACGLLALAAITLSWRRYGFQALGLRDELAAASVSREMRYVVMTTQVRSAVGEIWCVPFRPLAANRTAQRRQPQMILRAAA